MKNYLIRLWRSCRFSAIVATGALPLILITTAYYAPSLLPLVWLYPVGYMLLDAISTQIPGKWRILYIIAELALAGGAAWYTWLNLTDSMALLAPALLVVMILVGMVYPAAKRNEQLSPLWYILGVGIHLFAQVLLYSARVLENPALDPVSPWITGLFFLFAVISMLTMNESNLALATSGRQKVAKLMQRKNILMTLVFFAIAVLIASVPAIVKGAGEVLRWIIIGILWLYYMLMGKESESEGEAVSGTQGFDPSVLDKGTVSEMPQWLNILLMSIAMLMVAAVAIYAVYFLGKKLIVFVRYLIRVTGKYIHAVSEDYVDEISDTRDDDDDQNERRARKRRLSASEERKLTPEQRIRYRYQRLLQKHPEWDSGSTARETLPQSAAPLYERVRYGGQTVTEGEAQQFTAETKRI